MRTSSWSPRLYLAGFLLASVWSNGCQSDAIRSGAPDAASVAPADADRLGGAAGAGGTSTAVAGDGGSGVGGTGGATTPGLGDAGGAAAGAGGAGSSTSLDAGTGGGAPSTEQKYLFEVHNANFAWGSSHIDYYITADGNLYRAEERQPANGIRGAYTHDMTEEQLTTHHPSPATLVTTVALDVLREKLSLVSKAMQGELLSGAACADYGTVEYIGFGYVPRTGHYEAIVLGIDGDRAVQNTVLEAQGLVDWLAGVISPGAKRDCTYPEVCKARANCDVTDCSVCAGLKMTCVIDKLKKAHCGNPPSCGDSPTCACVGDAVCAGGAQLCAGTASSGFSCAPR